MGEVHITTLNFVIKVLRHNPKLQNCQLHNLKVPKRDKSQPLTGLVLTGFDH